MSNKFEVQVVALDKFTKVFRDLNTRASQAARPLVNVHRQVGALAHEMHLDDMAKGMGKVSGAAVSMTRAIGISLGPLQTVLGSVAGAGIVGALGAAAAGAVQLGVRFAGAGFEVTRTSQALGVSTRFLQRMRGAAKLAGVEVGDVDETVRGLGDTLQNARWSRDPTAAAVLNRFGIGIPMKNGQVDQEAALEGVERALARIADPHARDALANALHIPRGAIPLLMQGADAVKALGDEAERTGIVQGQKALQWSVDFTESLNSLKVAIDGVGNSMGQQLVPTLTKGVDFATRSIDAMMKKSEQDRKHPWTAYGQSVIAGLVPGGTLATYMGEMLLGGLQPGTTPAQRTVGGAVGAALHAGAFRPGIDVAPAAAGLPVPRNNPGNLRMWGSQPRSGGFATFATPAAGLAAMAQQLGLYGGRGLDTVSSIIGTWAPPSDHNDTAAYIADVSRRTGFAPGDHLDLKSPAVMSSLMQAMVRHEQGRQPFGADQYAAASKQAIVIDIHANNLPAGTTLTATQRGAGGGNTYTPTRIGYSMASGDMP